MKRLLPIAIIFSFFIGAGLYWKWPTSASLPHDVVFSSEIRPDRLLAVKRNLDEPQDLFSFRSDKGGILKMITFADMSSSQAEGLIKNKMMQLKLLYVPQPIAYAGMISKKTGCFQNILTGDVLHSSHSQISARVNLFANDRFIYGACSKEEATFRSQYLMLYCVETRTVFEFKYFYSKAEPELKEEIARCR